MKREVKFRGKRKDNGRWVYGYLFFNGTDLCIQQFEPIPPTCADPSGDSENYEIYPVVSETVGQYTNLKDKEGKEIYELDIITKNIFWDTSKKEIVYFEVVFVDSGFKLRDRMGNVYEIDSNSKIVGNICENPELLK